MIFSNPPKNLHTRTKHNTPVEEILKKLYLAEKQRIWKLEKNFEKSLLCIIGIKEIWRSIAFSLCCIMFFRFPAKCETLHFQQKLHVAGSLRIKIFAKCYRLLECGLDFLSVNHNLFCLLVKRIRLKLNRTRKSTEK